MKRELLTTMSAWMLICGCAGRMDADLLRARIREQAAQLSESQRDIAKTQTELNRTRQEAAQLRSELAQLGQPDISTPSIPMTKLRIHSLSSGGLNKDDQPGDDVVVVQFVQLDADNEPSQSPGGLEFRLIDPLLPETEREVGTWVFSAEQCRSHWTRGITGSGFQFSLPLAQPPRHTDLVVHLKYTTSDGRELNARHVVKVVTPPENTSMQTHSPRKARRSRPTPVQVVDESNEFLPPAGGTRGPDEGANNSDWENEESAPSKETPGRAVMHSTNWTDATIPQLR